MYLACFPREVQFQLSYGPTICKCICCTIIVFHVSNLNGLDACFSQRITF